MNSTIQLGTRSYAFYVKMYVHPESSTVALLRLAPRGKRDSDLRGGPSCVCSTNTTEEIEHERE